MGVQIFINFDNTSSVFRPGDLITGNVTINTSSQIQATGLTVSFHGDGFVNWTEVESRPRERRNSFTGIDQVHSSQRHNHLHPPAHLPVIFNHITTHHHHEHEHHHHRHHHHPHHENSTHHHQTEYVSSRKEYRNQETYIQSITALPLGMNFGNYSSGNSIELPAGYFQQIPFTFQLPLSIPSTCKLAHGSINYFAEVSLKIKHSLLVFSTETSKTAKKEFTILGSLDLAVVNDALSPVHLQKMAQFRKGLCCCVRGEGEFLMELRLARTGFVSGEPVIFYLNFSNETQATIKKIEAYLDQEIKYITFGKEKLCSTRLGTAVYNSKVVPGTTGSWNDQLRVPSDAYLSDMGGSRIIRVKYILKVNATVSLCRNCEIEVPITVGTVSSSPVY